MAIQYPITLYPSHLFFHLIITVNSIFMNIINNYNIIYKELEKQVMVSR